MAYFLFTFYKDLKDAKKKVKRLDYFNAIERPKPKPAGIIQTPEGYMVVSGEVFNCYFNANHHPKK